MDRNQRLLVTGATGKIGRELVKSLAEDYKILAVFRDEDKIFRQDGVSWLRGDVERIDDGFRAGINSVETIVHLAGRLGSFDEKCLETNWCGTKNLLKAIDEGRKIKLIFFSSIDAYGMTGEMEVDETQKENPFSVYGRSKLRAEKEIMKYAKQNSRFNYVILRVGNLDLDNYLMKFKDNKLIKWLFGENELSVVTIEKTVVAVKSLLKKNNYRNKIRFLAGKPISLNSLVNETKERSWLAGWFKDWLVRLMKMTRKGGFWYYLAAGGSKKPYRRYSNKLEKELGL